MRSPAARHQGESDNLEGDSGDAIGYSNEVTSGDAGVILPASEVRRAPVDRSQGDESKPETRLLAEALLPDNKMQQSLPPLRDAALSSSKQAVESGSEASIYRGRSAHQIMPSALSSTSGSEHPAPGVVPELDSETVGARLENGPGRIPQATQPTANMSRGTRPAERVQYSLQDVRSAQAASSGTSGDLSDATSLEAASPSSVNATMSALRLVVEGARSNASPESFPAETSSRGVEAYQTTVVTALERAGTDVRLHDYGIRVRTGSSGTGSALPDGSRVWSGSDSVTGEVRGDVDSTTRGAVRGEWQLQAALGPGLSPTAVTIRADLSRMPTATLAEELARVPRRAVEISLSPEELGRVHMTLSTRDTGLVLVVNADRADTLDLMRRHIDQLGQEFRRMGYQDIGFEFGQSGSEGRSERASDHVNGLLDDAIATSEVPEIVVPRAATRPSGAGSAGLDLRL
ncbi:flagellar hook-length control protein FliK [Albibacillus kandeliae]|uniref:flagellar hook-length control protein FliK n=1 Tax=Albibacillus kandeliae TaxID=2174228 RepID=UPI002FCDC01D